MDVFCGQDDIELAVLLEDVAFAHTAGDDGNHLGPFGIGRRLIAARNPWAKAYPTDVRIRASASGAEKKGE